MQNLWHEMSAGEFMKNFVPGPNMKPSQIRKVGDFKEMDVDYDTVDEATLYPVLCRVFNSVLDVSGSTAVLKDIADLPESGHIDMHPDLVLYPTDNSRARAAYKHENKAKSQVPLSRKKHLARCAWSWIEIFVECKCKEDESGFSFSGGQMLRDTPEARLSRAQISKYAAEIQLRQHRIHLFSLYVCRGKIRLQRWDRAGCIVSEPIDLLNKPTQMLNFIFRLANLDREQLGYDLTAMLATSHEIKKWYEHLPAHAELLKFRNYVANSQIDYPIYKITIPTYVEEQQPQMNARKRMARSSEKTQATRGVGLKNYLIGQPVSAQCEPAGRATKAYVGLDLENNQLVFIKDQWRANAAGVHPEIETYERLNLHNIAFVATCLGGGDVISPGHCRAQRTTIHEYFSEREEDCERIHTRIILKELGRPLETYVHSGELITATYHALLGHSEAWQVAGVLHRDVSIGNVMISIETPARMACRGFLIDWDLCKYKEELDNLSPALPGRSGTWPFMSALSLNYPRKPSEVADDIEAFIYIPVYMALRFHHHTMTKPRKFPVDCSPEALRALNGNNNSLAARVYSVFWEEEDCADGYVAGGMTKDLFIHSGTPPVQLSNANGILATLLHRFYQLLNEHYAAIDYADLERYKCEIIGSESGDGSDTSTTGDPEDNSTIVRFDHKDSDEDRIMQRYMGADAPRLISAPTEHSTSNAASHELRSRTDDSAVSVVQRNKRVLDGYLPIVKAFHEVLYQNGKWKDFSKVKDKWFDQFDGLQTYVGAGDQKSSSQTSSHSKTKRKRDEDAEYEEHWYKRIRGDSGWRVLHKLETPPQEGVKVGEEKGKKVDMEVEYESVGYDEKGGGMAMEATEKRPEAVRDQAVLVKKPAEPTVPLVRRSQRLAKKKNA